MGFIVDPERRSEAQERLHETMLTAKRELEQALPFAMDPVVYDFAINQRGTYAELLGSDVGATAGGSTGAAVMPAGYYTLTVPELLKLDRHELPLGRRAELDAFGALCRLDPTQAGTVQMLFDQLLPRSTREMMAGQSLDELLAAIGFDPVQHEQVRADLRNGRIGLAQNRLSANTEILDARPEDVMDLTEDGDAVLSPAARGDLEQLGRKALAEGKVAVVTLAAGVGSRWTHGAGVVKALHPFCKLGGVHRSFVEVHLAKSRRISRLVGTEVPHVFTTSYLTHDAIRGFLDQRGNYGYGGPLALSPGRAVGLRMIPMARDLRFAWEEMPQQLLDEQAQKVLVSLHAALINWAEQAGEGADYLDNVPAQCLHPVGHWYEIPNLLRNGVLAGLLAERPQLETLMMHNIDTVGADLSPLMLGAHLRSGARMTVEVITRRVEDRGGGLARIGGRVRLVEGMALPHDEDEFALSYYNSNTMWIGIDGMLDVFGLSRRDLGDQARVTDAVRAVGARMPTYVTLKDVKKRWGHGQEDVFPVAQFEKLWGDMTALPELACQFVVVPRVRGQQLKEQAQLDGWLRDGSAAAVEAICDWG